MKKVVLFLLVSLLGANFTHAMIIEVRTLDNQSFNIKVDPQHKIRDIKELFERGRDIPVSVQTFIANRTVIQDDEKTLEQLNITAGQKLLLIIREDGKNPIVQDPNDPETFVYLPG